MVYEPEPLPEEENAAIQSSIPKAKEASKIERKLSTEEEIALVKNMSNESAWSHVISEVMKEKNQAAKQEHKNEGSTTYSKIERKSKREGETNTGNKINEDRVNSADTVTEVVNDDKTSKVSVTN